MTRKNPFFASRNARHTQQGLAALAAPLALLLTAGAPNGALATGAPDVLSIAGLAVPSFVGLAAVVRAHQKGAVGKTNRIDGLIVEELDDGTTVLRVEGSAKPTFNVYRLGDPSRLVVDLAGAFRGDVVPHVPLDTWACGRVSIDDVSERNAVLVRLVVELKRDVSYVVVPKNGELVITITPRQVAPQAYFSRKNASQRRDELDARERNVRDDERTVRALGLEAKALNRQAHKRAGTAKAEAATAQAQAARAHKAEASAVAAERRALEVERAAGQALSQAKGQRIKVRRALRAAQAERERAEALRVQAQADRKRADGAHNAAAAKLAKALRDVKAEKAQVVAARGRAQQAEAYALKARGRAEAAERQAESLRSAAATDQRAAASDARAAASDKAAAAAAKRAAASDHAIAQSSRRAAASAKAAAASAKAAAVSAKASAAADQAAAASDKAAAASYRADAAAAKKRATAAERAAKAAQSQAETTLASARAELARAKAAASRAEADASSKLAHAERANAEAAKVSASASADAAATATLNNKAARASQALAKARDKVKQAEARADAKLAAAAQVEKEAKRTLTAARATAKLEAAKLVAAAATDRKAAKRDRAQAQAQAAQMAHRARREAKSEAERILADAGTKQESAAKLQAKAKAALNRAESAVAQAERERKTTLVLRHKADAEFAAAKKQARRAKRADKARTGRELEQARAAQRSAQTEQAASEAALARLRGDRNQLKSKLAQQHKLSGALDQKISSRKSELSRLEQRVAQAKRASEAQAKSAQQLHARSSRASEAKQNQLAQKNKDATRALTVAEADLAQLRASLQAERSELHAVTQDVEQARATLDGRLAEIETAKAVARAELKALADRAKVEASAPEKPTPPTHVATRIDDVRFEHDEHEQRVIVTTRGPIRFHGSSLTPTIKMLSFEDADIAKKLERSLDASSYGGVIKSITSFSEGDATKVLVSTFAPSKARLEERPGALVWHFPAQQRAPAPDGTEVVSMAGSKVAAYGPGPQAPLAAVPTQLTAFAPPPVGARSLGSPQANVQPARRRRTRWRGERIDIELQDAPIKDVLLLFSDIGHVNIIAGRGVEGSVTMKLDSVPWDQALDIIFRSLGLGSSREGNVIRVATVDDLEAERRQAIERANARVQLKPLVTRLVPVSYATVDEMIAKVASVLSPRGTVTPDQRTNTLIIMDVSDNIALAEQLIASLDTQTPQVLIEARIVEARTNFTRNLGIQWGFDFTASPGTGNPTGLLFPNSIGLGGGGTGQPADTRGLLLPGAAANPNYAVDLPAPVGTGQGGAIGFSFGSITGNLNTNLRLSAAESTGEVRIISAPKVVTLDNNEAQIETGVQIPISQVSASGVNTRFVNATLSLRVTPHVTNEGAVLLDVEVQKNEADFVNTGARGDPTILTNQARSRLLVNDADTAVIGGIYARNKAVNFTKIPWLADIPIVGWFFKNKSEADTRSEILIFLTPKIVNRASSIGG